MKGGTGYWNTDREHKEQMLEASWRAGFSATQIMRALQARFGGNVTRNAVIGKVHRLALPMHQPANNWRGNDHSKRRA